MTAGPEITCACCGRRGPHQGRGLRDACYRRVWVAGRLDDWPRALPVYGTAPYRVTRAAALDRVTDYAELRQLGVPQAEAAARVGITYRTASRYNRHLDQADQEQERTDA